MKVTLAWLIREHDVVGVRVAVCTAPALSEAESETSASATDEIQLFENLPVYSVLMQCTVSDWTNDRPPKPLKFANLKSVAAS